MCCQLRHMGKGEGEDPPLLSSSSAPPCDLCWGLLQLMPNTCLPLTSSPSPIALGTRLNNLPQRAIHKAICVSLPQSPPRWQTAHGYHCLSIHYVCTGSNNLAMTWSAHWLTNGQMPICCPDFASASWVKLELAHPDAWASSLRFLWSAIPVSLGVE